MKSEFEKLECEIDENLSCLAPLRAEDERLYAEVAPRVKAAIRERAARARRLRPWVLWGPTLGGIAAAVALFAISPNMSTRTHVAGPAAEISNDQLDDLAAAMSASSDGIATIFTDSAVVNVDSENDDLGALQDFYDTLSESPRGGA